MFPEISTTAPNSPTARANASATPDRIAGSRFGKTIRRKIANEPAPSEAAASSISVSSSSSTGCTARTTKGRVTNSSARSRPVRVKATLTPNGPPGPYSASSVSPATIVGSANGRSINASTTPLPRKRSRTSVQAIAVPATAFSTAQTAATPRVSLSAATASGRVACSQNAESPPERELQTKAARGSKTTRLR